MTTTTGEAAVRQEGARIQALVDERDELLARVENLEAALVESEIEGARATWARDEDKKALLAVVLALESVVAQAWEGEFNAESWDAYESARSALGKPIKLFSGGEAGTHYHPLAWDKESVAACGVCAAWREDHPAGEG